MRRRFGMDLGAVANISGRAAPLAAETHSLASVYPFAAFPYVIIGVRGWLAFNAAPIVATSFATITAIT